MTWMRLHAVNLLSMDPQVMSAKQINQAADAQSRLTHTFSQSCNVAAYGLGLHKPATYQSYVRAG